MISGFYQNNRLSRMWLESRRDLGRPISFISTYNFQCIVTMGLRGGKRGPQGSELEKAFRVMKMYLSLSWHTFFSCNIHLTSSSHLVGFGWREHGRQGERWKEGPSGRGHGFPVLKSYFESPSLHLCMVLHPNKANRFCDFTKSYPHSLSLNSRIRKPYPCA